MLLSLAWKNIWRNKKRSLIVVLAITFGLWGGLFSGSIMMGMGESIVNTAIDRDLAHLQLHHKEFKSEKDISLIIPNSGVVIESLGEMTEVDAACGRFIIEGMAASANSNFGVQITSIDPQKEKSVTNLYTRLIEGSYFESDRKNQIVIGKKLAERLNLKLRSKIILSFQGIGDEIIHYACRVSGIYKSESSQFDELYVYVSQKDLFRLLDSKPAVHEIAVRLKSAKILDDVKMKLSDKYPGLLVERWTDMAPELAFLSVTMQNFTYLFVAIILCALLFGITNTMLMSVVDRIREFGILLALGMKKGKIFLMIILETVFLSLTGGAGGILIGGLTIWYFSGAGIDLSIVAASMESFGSSTMLYPYLPYIMYIILTIMIVLSANVAAIFPAIKAIRLRPAEAIRTL
jgi:putative ABC transport system permease protein